MDVQSEHCEPSLKEDDETSNILKKICDIEKHVMAQISNEGENSECLSKLAAIRSTITKNSDAKFSQPETHSDVLADTRGASVGAWMDSHCGAVFNSPSAVLHQKSSVGDTTSPNTNKVNGSNGNKANGAVKLYKPSVQSEVRRVEEQAITKEVESSVEYKKAVPEPRPRKKSISPCSSLSEEVVETVPSQTIFPVPKPRVICTTTTSGLRLPSSYISRRAADFSVRSHSMDGSDANNTNSNNGPIVKPERKFTPPKQEPLAKPQEVSPPTASVPKVLSNKRIETVFGQVSKFRNFKVTSFHKKLHIENLRNICTTCPGESELIQANSVRIAVPLNTPGGKIAVFELSKPGRQPDGVIPALVHGSKVMDFCWDPFNNARLVVGCDGGKLWVWKIPEDGLKEQTNIPDFTVAAHAEKIYFVKFHPLAQDILATGSYDLSIRIWDLGSKEGLILIPCHEQIQIFSFSWSPCGAYFSTMAKDGKIRIYEPRNSVQPALEKQGPAGVRGGRVCWALDGRFLVVSGFDRSSERQVHMYSSADLSRVVVVPLDVSPAILVPFYDDDSSMLFLSGRGDSTIFAFDVTEDAPYLRLVHQHRSAGAHQGVSWLKKNALEVQNVEFARAYRLTEVVIEPLSFTVPRVKNEYFQDDLFPPTKVLWEPTMTAEQWISGMNLEPRRVSLKPHSMKAVGEISGGFHKDSTDYKNGTNKAAKNSVPIHLQTMNDLNNGVKKQQEKLEQSIKEKLTINMKLEQDSMEGVDEEEWNE